MSTPLKMDISTLPTDEAVPFLFVNESGDLPPSRIGHRHDIRSHVRRHATRQIKIGWKKVATQRKLAPRRPKDLGYISDHPDGIGANLISTSKDFSELRDTDDSMFRYYCKTCGAQLHSPIDLTKRVHDGQTNMAKHTSQPRLGLSPIGILGAGRVDPFLSYPVENPGRYLHEIVDLVVTYVIPGFIPDENSNQSSVNSVAKAWILAGLRTPLLFHALVFAGIIYYDFMRRSKIFFNSPLALSHKLIVIQKIRDTILAGGEEASRDEVLLAIVILATHDIANVAKEGKMPFNSPLKKAGWLNFYGKTHEVPEHAKAITDIIGLRGGIKSLKLPGLIEILAGRDLILAVNSISKPAIPLIIRESCITSTRAWAKSPLRMPSHISLASAFKRFADYGITDDMVEAFDSVGHITMAIDYYIQGMPGSLPLGRIIRTRTAVQKLVMLLPAAKELELNISASSMPSIYECCRLTAIIFGVAVIFPVSNSYDILQTLVQLLKAEIEISQIESTEECLDVFLWMLILGGIAALDKLERPWFVSQLVLLIERSKEKLYWIEVEHKLKGFLWLDIACGASARRVWNEVLNLVL